MIDKVGVFEGDCGSSVVADTGFALGDAGARHSHLESHGWIAFQESSTTPFASSELVDSTETTQTKNFNASWS